MKNLPIMKRGKVTGLANVVNSASADLSIAIMGIGIQVVSQSYCEFNLAHETNENLQHMPVLGIVSRRFRDIFYTTVVVFLTSPSALPQARQCPRAGQRDFLKSTFCCCTEGEGCTKHFKRDLAPGEGRRVVSSGGSAAYSEYYETLARECDGTYSTGWGMMGRTIGSDDGRDRIAGKARHAPQPAACVCGVGVVCVVGDHLPASPPSPPSRLS